MAKERKILVIDDDESIIELLKDRLQTAGYKVVIAFDGMQGVRVAHQEKPDLIILDIMLPAGGGYIVLDRLKISTDTVFIPVITISCTSPEDVVKVIIEKQVDKHGGKIFVMPKPINFEKLIEKIKEFIGE
ncbi:MAG: response regulator [Elusimicrobiota bacterium]